MQNLYRRLSMSSSLVPFLIMKLLKNLSLFRLWILSNKQFSQHVSCMPGAFRNNISFITVSQSPNLKVVLETMWEKIVHKKKPQSVEYAHRQLLRRGKPTLVVVVLNDVWSKPSLENLLFEGES